MSGHCFFSHAESSNTHIIRVIHPRKPIFVIDGGGWVMLIQISREATGVKRFKRKFVGTN